MSTEQTKPFPAKTLQVKIWVTADQENTYEVKLPNTGEELDIAGLLYGYTNDRYDKYKISYLDLFQREAIKVEAMAFFWILIPKLKEDLNVKSFLQLDHEKMARLVDAYETQFFPWYEQWQAIFATPKAEK